MELNLQTIKATAPEIIEYGNWYNAVIEICNQYFGNKSVKVNQELRQITVKSNINLKLTYSFNEGKIYVQTSQEPYQPQLSLKEMDYTPRFFDLETVYNYLTLKKQESEFVTRNDG